MKKVVSAELAELGSPTSGSAILSFVASFLLSFSMSDYVLSGSVFGRSFGNRLAFFFCIWA